MGWDIVCKYCMLFIAMFIVLYFVGKMIRQTKTQEGFTADAKPEVIVGKIQDITNYLNDELIISQYRDDYESLILSLDSWADMSMLNILATENIGTAEYTTKTSTDIRTYNQLADFKKNLSTSLTFLDNSKE